MGVDGVGGEWRVSFFREVLVQNRDNQFGLTRFAEISQIDHAMVPSTRVGNRLCPELDAFDHVGRRAKHVLDAQGDGRGREEGGEGQDLKRVEKESPIVCRVPTKFVCLFVCCSTLHFSHRAIKRIKKKIKSEQRFPLPFFPSLHTSVRFRRLLPTPITTEAAIIPIPANKKTLPTVQRMVCVKGGPCC